MRRIAVKYPVLIILLWALLPFLNLSLASSVFLGGRVELRILPHSGEVRLPLPVRVMIENVASGERQEHWIQSSELVSFDLVAGEYEIRIEAQGRQPVRRRIHRSDFAGPGPIMLTMAVGPPKRSRLPSPEAGTSIHVDVLRVPQKALRELNRAEKAQQRGHFQKAIQHLEKAVAIDPDFFQAHNNLGAIYMRLARPAEARKSLDRALRIRPDDPMALRNLAYLQLSGSQFDQAVETLSHLIRVRPSDCWAFEYRGEALYQLGRTAQAESSFNQALSLDSGSSVANYRLGEIAYKRQDLGAALAYFRSFLQSDFPGDSSQVEKLVEQLEAALNQRQNR